MVKIYTLKEEAKTEVYKFIEEFLRKLPKNKDGSFNEFEDSFIDNDVDALRHAYVSGVYTMEYSTETAERLGLQWIQRQVSWQPVKISHTK